MLKSIAKMKKIAKSQSILIVEAKKTLYLQRNECSKGSTRINDFVHLCHAVVACHGEAVQRRFSILSPFVCQFFATVLTIALFILPQGIAAQDGVEGYKSLIPQAPDAQALARAIDIPVNAYTGIPQITIPLYEIKVGELTIPISLSYHAGGILANQEATEVGLGWSLSAGGSITRTIKCIDDFNSSMGYFSYQQDWDGEFSTLMPYFNIWTRQFVKDMEPDIFFYSTPTESGKFFFDHSRNAHFVNVENNCRLEERALTNTLEITDSKGNRYLYEDIEETQPYSSASTCLVNTTSGGYDAVFDGYNFPGFQASERFKSAWKLSRIITPSGDSVTFTYQQIKYQLPVQETAVKRSRFAGGGSLEGMSQASSSIKPGLSYSQQKCWVNGKRLTEIRWRGGVVCFEVEDREDLLPLISSAPKPKAVKVVKVLDPVGSIVKKWLLNYSYFNPFENGANKHLFKRLKLNSVKEILPSDSIGYSFSYDESRPLPAKNTKNTDYWGYYNGSNQGSNYVCPAVLNGELYAGGDKEPNLLYTKLGTLESITNPTGGTTVFTYENNTAANAAYTELGQRRYTVTASRSTSSWYMGIGSVSIDTFSIDFRQKVTISAEAFNYDDINTQTNYSFVNHTAPSFQFFSLDESGSSHRLFSFDMPDTWDDSQDFYNDSTLQLDAGRYIMRVECIVEGFVTDMNMDCKEYISHPGEERLVGGLRVRRIDGEKNVNYEYSGGILFKEPVLFQIERACFLDSYSPSWVDYFCQLSESVGSLSSIANGQTMGYSEVLENLEDGSYKHYQYHNEPENYLAENYPMAGTQTDWLNGSLLELDVYDTQNNLSEATIYDYSDAYTGQAISGFVFDGNRMVPYENDIFCKLPIRTLTETHLSNGVRTAIDQKTYNTHFLCSSEIFTIGNDSIVTRYFYPFNLTDSVSQQMVEANIIGSPVAQLKSKNGTIFDGAWTRYGKFDGRILPSQELRLNTDQTSTNLTSCRFDTIMEYRDYDKYSNPRWMSYKGTPVTCLWGYHGMHPVIEVVGASINNVQYFLSPYTVSSLLDASSITSTQLRDWHNVLQESFPDFSVSACRYVPLVGPSEIIGADGIATTYEYDPAGRLTGKRLHGTDLLQRFTYHYGAENYRTTACMLDDNATDTLLTVQYYDQWGRPSLLASQDKSTDRKFSYSLQTYDFLGRPSREWNPLPTSDVTPHSMTEAAFASASASYYSDTLAFSETSYDALGNAIRVTIPGEAWKDEGRQNTYRYLTNESNEVKRYSITTSGGLSGGNTYYPTGTLLCTEQRDPDGKKVRKYSDIFDNVILERQTDSLETFDTYYVYDALNRLRMVLSPKCQESSDDIAACRYEYRYNGKGQVTWKRLPGCEPVQYWYNKQGLPVCMQDGMLRSDSRYRFFLYDRLGRLCIQGITPQCYQQRQFSCISQTLQGQPFMDTGYIYQGNPTELNQSNCTLEQVNYYDSYQYLGIPQPIDGVEEYADSLGIGNSRAHITGTRQYASNGEALLTTFAYDDRGRICRTGEFGLNGRLTVTDSRYNFFDGIDNVRTAQYTCNSDIQPWTGSILQTYTYYPHTILPHSTTLTITSESGSSSSETIRSLSYNDFGNITGNNRSGTAADMTYTYDLLHGWVKEISSSGGFEQRLYREDNTGHKLYNGSISAMTWIIPDERHLRRYDYTYDGMNRLIEGAYSHMLVFTPHPGIINSTGDEMFSTDEASPLGLIPVVDGIGDLVGPINFNAADRYSERISYDKNSNINSIERYGMNNQRQYGLIDSLVITRNGNQLKAIEDYAQKHLTYTGASDFYDGDSSSSEYLYNANGSLVSDFNREIDWTYYDNLGNTREICFCDHSSTEYIYASDGTKLRTIHRPVSSTALTDSIDYIGNLILKNSQPEMYLFDGGYATFDANGVVDGWHYYIQDYLGNNRMVVNKNGNVEQITHYYPYGGVIGDISTNESLQAYKFEGKELDRTFGLDNYDIHARQYFAMMPSWDRIDPLAEKYYGISPYVYCGGDPVNMLDISGDSYYALTDSGKVVLAKETEDKYDYLVASNGEKQLVNDQSILSDLSNGKTASSKSTETVDLFFFASDHTIVEWGLYGYTDGKYMIKTDNEPRSVTMPNNNNNKWLDMHSHPGTENKLEGSRGGSFPDINTFRAQERKAKETGQKMYLAFVYHKNSGYTYRYNSSSKGSTQYYLSKDFKKMIPQLKNMYKNQ